MFPEDWKNRFAKAASREALSQFTIVRWGESPTEGDASRLNLDAIFRDGGPDVLWVKPEVIALVYRGCGHVSIGHLS